MYIWCIYMYNTVYKGAYAAIKVDKRCIQGIYYDVGSRTSVTPSKAPTVLYTNAAAPGVSCWEYPIQHPTCENRRRMDGE